MTSSKNKPLILVDGSSYLFRAYHALPPLINSKGQPTGAVYGVINMLKRLLKDYDPEYVAVIFDPKGGSFRNDLYAEYKANRDEMPDELQIQIKPLHDIIKSLGLPLIIEQGMEADDVIGTLTKQAQQQGMPVLISTGDKDMAQLVNKDVSLINTMTNKMLDPEGVVEKFGVKPELIIDYLALMGDTSDNIPGVPKVGPKTAAKWLNEYGSLDAIVKNAENIKGKVGENLRAHLGMLPLAKQLVTIKCDVKLNETIADLTLSQPDAAELMQQYKELEFRKWLNQVEQAPEDSVMPSPQEPNQYDMILDEENFNTWLAKLKSSKQFSFDTETTDIDAMRADLVGVSFAVESGHAAYVPLTHDYMGAPKQLDKDWVLQQLQPILTDGNKCLVGQNIKYDLKVLWNAGVKVEAQFCDTMLQSYVLNNVSTRHDLDTLSLNYLSRENIKFEDVAGKGAKQLTFNQVSLEQATPYAAEDADATLQLQQIFSEELKERPQCQKVFNEIEMPLMHILAEMEYGGVLIDSEMLRKQSSELHQEITGLRDEIFSISGQEFNIDSPKQLREILFEKLKLPISKKTPTGQPSTAENVMQELALDYPMPKLILQYRSLSKLKSTYTDKLPLQVNPKTGRVHTHYNQTVTSTGRLSSNNPNLQNIPIRTEQGRRIRKAFIAPTGYRLLAADYSQVELRIMAHLSQDPGLVKAFNNGWDVHASTAAEVFSVPLEEVTSDQRRSAKAINFGLMYGMSSFGLGQQLGIGRDEAQQHIDVYFSRYPSVQGYMEKSRQDASDKGYVETLFGRRIMVPEINSKNGLRRKAAERAAINAPLQGTAADIIKLAMICVQNWIKQSGADVKMIMQVHDELVFEIAEKTIEEATQHIRDCMQNAAEFSIPLIVDIGVGDNWDEAH
ncbi:MAG: DNA polymerase I [Gammaproteobacteria bacterium]|nr:DNA polymerase I [Gammaproteobacteria bacterium]MCH9743976.1 DNA polymerase I [Gammaproteobacteria bacterium]